MALRIRWCAKEVRCGDREFRFGTKKIYVEKVISIDRGAIYIFHTWKNFHPVCANFSFEFGLIF